MQSSEDRLQYSEWEPNKKLKTVRTLDQAGCLVDVNKSVSEFSSHACYIYCIIGKRM